MCDNYGGKMTLLVLQAAIVISNIDNSILLLTSTGKFVSYPLYSCISAMATLKYGQLETIAISK